MHLVVPSGESTASRRAPCETRSGGVVPGARPAASASPHRRFANGPFPPCLCPLQKRNRASKPERYREIRVHS